ncbi:unnamed protein product [Allacma fusca]|uniref:Uncharacterized protein n=1 Tax=Allacma fusca TaxID=39272 RepID=A0A8J2KB66_9HEXA|nr:unnamed protein product [Allacma fusca]
MQQAGNKYEEEITNARLILLPHPTESTLDPTPLTRQTITRATRVASIVYPRSNIYYEVKSKTRPLVFASLCFGGCGRRRRSQESSSLKISNTLPSRQSTPSSSTVNYVENHWKPRLTQHTTRTAPLYNTHTHAVLIQISFLTNSQLTAASPVRERCETFFNSHNQTYALRNQVFHGKEDSKYKRVRVEDIRSINVSSSRGEGEVDGVRKDISHIILLSASVLHGCLI